MSKFLNFILTRSSLELSFSMAGTLNLNGQRWVYEKGNYQIVIDNAWAIPPMYAQERITVNGEHVRDRVEQNRSILLWRTIFEDTVLDSTGELELKVQWKSGFNSIKCRLLIESKKQVWTKYYETKWTGPKGKWPEESYYEEDD